MLNFRKIPLLLIEHNRAIKTVNYIKKYYLGDPLNICKIFSDLFVDELLLIDISHNSKINLMYLKILANAVSVPFSYGGKIKTPLQAESIIKSGFEKIVVTSLFFEKKYKEINEISKAIGGQSIVVKIDIIFKNNCYYLFDPKTKQSYNLTTEIFYQLQSLCIGEVLISSVNNDGARCGYDLNLIKVFCKRINNKIIIQGGCSSVKDFDLAAKYGAAAASASYFFSYANSYNSTLPHY